MPCTGSPSPSAPGAHTSPSLWNPAASGWKPRSITASSCAPTHADGTSAVHLNQVVPHGRLHLSPMVNGRAWVAIAAIASAYDTGSAGVSHACTSIGTLAEYIAGSTRSVSSLRMRRSSNTVSSCMRRG